MRPAAALLFSVIAASAAADAAEGYLLVDLSGGPAALQYPVSRIATLPPGGWSDLHKRDILVLKELPPGRFRMGAKRTEMGADFANEWYEGDDEVTLSHGFAIGVFEVTQRQWERVMGTAPSAFKGETRPVESVSYMALRGDKKGLGWPVSDNVDPDSFVGRLRERTGLPIDLPTDAQWEYACRAGTATQLGTGKDITGVRVCPNVAETARYAFNTDDGKGGGFREHVAVGSYVPNRWGLYDFHGNVAEWCLDRWGNNPRSGERADPKGPSGGRGWRRPCGRPGSWM